MKIHFIGIGGIGTSALAQYYLAQGHLISGSDLTSSEIIEFLKKKGVKIFIKKPPTFHFLEKFIKEADLIIYSLAIPQDHPELKKAKSFKINCLSYPQALGQLTKSYFTIAVAGSHGKSTTTALIGLILTEAGFDPTVIVGTKLREFGDTNFRLGRGKYLVIEADEWRASFLNYWPQIVVLTNIEKEHLDYYKNLNHILKTFLIFLSHLPKNGFLVANGDDKNIKALTQKIISKKTQIQVKNILYFSKSQKREWQKIKKILKIPGQHNIANALAAWKTSKVLGVEEKVILKVLSNYQGAWRRLEEKRGKINDRSFIVISDYGHHPTEILATLKGVREKFKENKIWLIFQPHQYQRTFYLFKDFVKTFQILENKNLVQKIIITDIFEVSGREDKKIKKIISAEKLVKKVASSQTIYLSFEEIIPYLKKHLKGKEILVIMGAGDIYKLDDKLSTVGVDLNCLSF